MIELFVFRHGETLWNRATRMQGHTDTELSDLGETQACDLRGVIKDLSLERVLSSDLRRARRTAELATQGLSIPLEIHPDLREARFGQLEGLTRDEIIQREGEEFWSKWLSVAEEHMDVMAPGGETKRQVLARIRDFLRSYFERNAGLKRVGICSHGGVLARLLHSAEASPSDRLRIENCRIYRLDFIPESGRWIYRG